MKIRDYRKVDVAVVGAGHAGLSAVREVRRHKGRCVLISEATAGAARDRDPPMPSVSLNGLANNYAQSRRYHRLGIAGSECANVAFPRALGKLRELQDSFVDHLVANATDGLNDDALIGGHARLLGPNHLLADGQVIQAEAIVVATGSRSAIPQQWRRFFDGTLASEEIFESEVLPGSVAVIGLGPAGLELGQALHRLGVDVSGFDQAERLARIDDPDVDAEAIQILRREFPIIVGNEVSVERYGKRFRVRSGSASAVVDKLLFATGREPNSSRMEWDRIGVPTDARGIPSFDPATLQIPGTSIFLAGDANGGNTDLHEAAAQGRVAGYNAMHESRITLPHTTDVSIGLSDPSIMTVGARWNELDPAGTVVGELRLGAPGLATGVAGNAGLLKLYAHRRSARLLGGSMVGRGCGQLAHMLAHFIQRGLTVGEALRAQDSRYPVVDATLHDGLCALQRTLDSESSGRELCGDQERGMRRATGCTLA